MSMVLVVDDVKTDRDLIGQVVAAAGHSPEYAIDGEDGMAKAKALKPALILLDVVMPKQDGYDTCRKLKKDADTAGIPVVMVTVKGTDSDKFWGQRQGCSDYVVKPFTPTSLADVIRKNLR